MVRDTRPLNKSKPKNPYPISYRTVFIIIASLSIIIGTTVYTLEEEEDKLQRQLESYDNGEQYALLATINGWYTCCNCSKEKVFLLRGEVWKYGSTIKKNRYSDSYLKSVNVEYIVEFEGNQTACRKEEIRKIRMYKFSPENIKRTVQKRLLRPPGNCKNY